MSPLVAAVVLLYVLVILLAFGFAGLLAKVRELELGSSSAASGTPESATAIAAVAPRDGRSLAVVLLMQESCGVCQEVLPHFVAEMATSSELLDFVVLVDGEGHSVPQGPRVVTDPVVHRALEPGWFPAILLVSSDHIIERVEPAGSPEAVQSVLAAARRGVMADR